jgi:hypothetical protein
MAATTTAGEQQAPPPQMLEGTVEIVVPVYNEAATLEASIRRLQAYLGARFPFSATVTVVDNASTDGTYDIALSLAAALPGVRALRLDRKGRGLAIRTVWEHSDASVVAYMDVDLSTDLDALLPLVAPLVSGHSDLAIGSRLARGSRVVRGPKRELLSRGYNLLIKTLLRNQFSDAQCGFKAMRTDVARVLVPRVKDDAWFFDTELLVLAERAGLRIHEVPVDWVDDPDSRVDIVKTVTEDLKGVWRLLSQRGPVETVGERSPELARFVGVGAVSTVADVVLFLVLRGPLGLFLANAVALALCTAANLAVHLWLTAGRGPVGARVAAAAGTVSLACSLVVSTALLAVAQWLAPGSTGTQVVALLASGALVAFGRFVLLRAVVFRRHVRGRSQ